jgi:hypothetical protein
VEARRRGRRHVGSVRQRHREKEKGGGEVGRCGDGEMGMWAGWVGKGGEVLFYFFFFFPFSNSFKIRTFFNSNSFKIFQTFSQNFINSLNLIQATKNHA